LRIVFDVTTTELTEIVRKPMAIKFDELLDDDEAAVIDPRVFFSR
jgi:hypothetical protein